MIEINKLLTRKTRGELDGSHGRDARRKLVVALNVGDVIEFRPHGRRIKITGSLFDAYRFFYHCTVQRMERLVREYKKTMPLAEARRKARKECGF